MSAASVTLSLANGHNMPVLGFGTWLVDKDVVGQAVIDAAKAGYRHFDCAERYQNQREVGVAFNALWSEGFKREDFFITSKLWCTRHDKAEESIRQTLKNLQIEYLDLYLIHFPEAFPAGTEEEVMAVNCMIAKETGENPYAPVTIEDTWTQMETLVEKKFTRSVGVSNFATSELKDILSYAKIRPAANQVELHPYNASPALVDFCAKENIAVTGYTSLANPFFLNEIDPDNPQRPPVKLDALMQNEKVTAVAKAHNKSAAQILLRWGIQRGYAVLIKTLKPDRLKENMAVFDFELSASEMQSLLSLNCDYKIVNPPWRVWPEEA